jgi:hypothetical protein
MSARGIHKAVPIGIAVDPIFNKSAHADHPAMAKMEYQSQRAVRVLRSPDIARWLLDPITGSFVMSEQDSQARHQIKLQPAYPTYCSIDAWFPEEESNHRRASAQTMEMRREHLHKA